MCGGLGSASWLNAVESFFAKLPRQRLKHGVFKGIVDLQAASNRYLAETNNNPKPFTWTPDPDAIIEKVRRGSLVQVTRLAWDWPHSCPGQDGTLPSTQSPMQTVRATIEFWTS